MRHKRAVLITFLLLACLVGGTVLWLRAQRRQYALNRALIAALGKGNNRRALALVEAGGDPNTRYKATRVPSLPELVKQMLHRSPPPINDSETAFSIACGAEWDDKVAASDVQQDRPDDALLVQAMLTHGATVNVKDEVGASPLMWAASYNRLKMTRLLLEHGAGITAQDASGTTPRMYAAVTPTNPDMVRLLLEHGADVNTQDKDRQTALHQAMVDASNKGTIHQLLTHGADPNRVDNYERTPLMLARSEDSPDLVALLKQYGAKDTGKRP